MKYLKQFNESAETLLTTVTFESGEEVAALYIDGLLYKYGDYYHDKIRVCISAFKDVLEWSGKKFIDNKIECKNDKINEYVCELGGIPPNNLGDINEISKEV